MSSLVNDFVIEVTHVMSISYDYQPTLVYKVEELLT